MTNQNHLSLKPHLNSTHQHTHLCPQGSKFRGWWRHAIFITQSWVCSSFLVSLWAFLQVSRSERPAMAAPLVTPVWRARPAPPTETRDPDALGFNQWMPRRRLKVWHSTSTHGWQPTIPSQGQASHLLVRPTRKIPSRTSFRMGFEG